VHSGGFVPAAMHVSPRSRRNDGNAIAIEGRKFIKKRLKINEFFVADMFDLPVDAVELSITLLVTNDTDWHPMAWMDVDFNAPPNRRHS